MATVQSFGQLQTLSSPHGPQIMSSSASPLELYGLSQAYAQIYRSQPNVRICVDFIARNIAQLGIHAFRRISDTDRERLSDHDLAQWLSNPNPGTTRFRLVEDLLTDLGIYFRAYWLKVRYTRNDGRPAIGLVRLPPEEVMVEGHLLPTKFIWSSGGQRKEFEPSEIVHFSGYQLGISPLETLRRILAEESAAGMYRESLWGHGAKHEGIWERANDSPNHTPAQLKDWREQWQEFANTSKAGQTAVGERGWKYVPTSFSSKDSEYIQGGKLRREICAAVWHIPLPLVGILDHATFSNVKEQHKHLYQDCLGPWNEMVTQEIERQLLPECEDQDRVYVEFNIEAKLAGSFEEQSNSLRNLTGRPIMTANEGRARLNLPRDPDPQSDKIAPQQGGPALAADTVPVGDADATAALSAHITQAHQARQQARLQKADPIDRPSLFEASRTRWTNELASDLSAVLSPDQAHALALATNRATQRQLLEAAEDAATKKGSRNA
jgi:HK97 family phage portal protein